jgi:cytoskeletal protein CcmA (bactofilin family)
MGIHGELMVRLDQSIVVRGEIRSTDNLTIEGTVEGPVWTEGLGVTVAAGATIIGDIFARDITVFGTVSGTLRASTVVDIRESGRVSGQVICGKLILADGAWFTGTAQPERADPLGERRLTLAWQREA